MVKVTFGEKEQAHGTWKAEKDKKDDINMKDEMENWKIASYAILRLTCIANVSEDALWYDSSWRPIFWAVSHRSLVSSQVRSTKRCTSRLGQTSTCMLCQGQLNKKIWILKAPVLKNLSSSILSSSTLE